MNYTILLNQIIKESKMTNVEIIKRCGELGENITPNYLSILRNTEGRIPSENVSKAIAKVCKAEYEDILVIQAYIDKAPKGILAFANKIYEGSIKLAWELTLSKENELEENEFIAMKQSAKEQIEKLYLAKFICEYMNDENEGIDIPEIKVTQEKEWVAVPLKNAKFITEEQFSKLSE
ncbi:MAG: hypothetical protein EOM34_09640 [Clostridia bacterium]|jgi:hypothetical protein|nr:hypothetical protein [Lachnospiraceae bacterium]NCC00926.1 hypothetical protein [Clostridia bacterium]NCD02414.1 hypothetical protein [Clostridia bacterium]